MKKYLNDVFGLCVKIEKWDRMKKLPLYLRNKREYFVLYMGDEQSILMKNNSDDFNISRLEKEMQEIENYSEMPVILWIEAVSTYQRNSLVKNRISFIIPNSQIYVPQWGTCLRELCAAKRKKVEKLSATTQYILLYFIYQQKHEEKSQSELAKYLNVSAMNVSRAVLELQELKLLEVHKEKNQKLVKSVAIGKKLYQLSDKYMQSPVQKKIYVSFEYFDKDLPFAGETALAKRTMLNYPKCTVFAMDKKYAKDIPEEAIVKPELIKGYDYVEIELWKYNPLTYAIDESVDIVSLVQSLKKVEDERVEMQIEEMIEEHRW